MLNPDTVESTSVNIPNSHITETTHITPNTNPNFTHSNSVPMSPTNPSKTNSQAAGTYHGNFLLWNARSLNKQISKFQSYVYAAEYDIIAITETWLSSNIYSNEILPNDYNIIRRDRDTRGGGVLLAIKNSIPFKQLPMPDNLEILPVEITINKQVHTLCLIYRPPNADDLHNKKILNYLQCFSHTPNFTILGDLNLPDVCWEGYCGVSDISESFADLAYNFNLIQLVSQPTHRAGNTLDVVLTNTEVFHDVQIKSDLPFSLQSDHFMVFLSVFIQNDETHTKKVSKQVFNFAAADWDSMCHYLLSYNFYPCLISLDIEFIWDYIKAAICTASDLFIPKMSFKPHKQPVWFNSTIRHKLNCIHTLRRKHIKRPTAHSKVKLDQAETELQQLMVSEKANYEAWLIRNYSNSNNHKIFHYISTLKGHAGLPAEVCYGEQTASVDSEKARLFNEYFFSVFLKDEHSGLTCPPIDNTHLLQDIEISTTEVHEILSTLDITKAPGIDGISPAVLRHCAAPLLIPVCHLFTSSIITGKIPLQWCTHCITPIHKSGSKTLVNNYRPISLLCIISKVLERIIYNRIMNFTMNTFTPFQFGFLPKRSTLQQLILFTERLLDGKNNKNDVDVIYMDFKKAFDSVSHNALLSKLQALGISGRLWAWLETYLKTRIQCVRIGNDYSDFCKVLSGVPQGSILGPLLFGIFINDLPSSVVHSIPYLYADDTKCLNAICSSADTVNLQSDLDRVSSWSLRWKLLFNENKFVHIRFSSTYSINTATYKINNREIDRRMHHKDLGIIYSYNLTWSEHYDHIIVKAYNTLGLLRRTFKINNIQAKKQLYISLVRSQLLYCSQIWRAQLIKDILKLERIQRRATKYILNNYDLSYKQRLQQLHMLPLMYTYELNDLMFFIKTLKSPSTHFDISKYIQFSNHNTRAASTHKLSHHRAISSCHHKSYFNRIIRLWNSMPVIDLSLSSNTIKTQLTNYMWSKFNDNFTDSPCTFHLLCPCHRCSKFPITPNHQLLSNLI